MPVISTMGMATCGGSRRTIRLVPNAAPTALPSRRR